MNVSLDQAIEIHARALRRRNGRQAPHQAREKARRCMETGDAEGQDVWLRVAKTADDLLAADRAAWARHGHDNG